MRREENIDPHIYRIGAVSRLTSIPTGTIRVWERRYGVVEPGRSDGGFRLYSHRDVERLRVIKSLIENGETIGSLAGLNLIQLKQRLVAHGVAAPEPLQHPLEVDVPPATMPGSGRMTPRLASTPSGITGGSDGSGAVGETTGRDNSRTAGGGVTDGATVSAGLGGDDDPVRRRRAPIRVVVAGESLSVAMRVASTSFDDLELVEGLPDWRGRGPEIGRLSPDLFVLEQPSIHIETVDELQQVVRTSGARHVLVVYQFGSEAALRALESERVAPVKGPLGPTQLQLALRLAIDRAEPPREPERSRRFIEAVDQRPPPARFDPATMARIAAQSKVVHCECPQHLATLISSLMAFEAYCRECESRSEADAALHAALERSTGQARATLEDALDYLLQVENITP